MMSEKMRPPKTCPVCKAVWNIQSAGRTVYECGAVYIWARNFWDYQCPYAMTAALRVGATLNPTPRELAEKALVAEAIKTYADDDWEQYARFRNAVAALLALDTTP